jgi:hemerythrin-like domain-containing protein
MAGAIEDLRSEHTAILAALQTLEVMTGRLQTGGEVEAGDLRDFVGFLKEFADTCHHGKEEGILFPALVKAGMPQDGGPVGVMLAEHAAGRGLIRRMEAAASTSPVDRRAFAEASTRYTELLRDHIEKENGVLFPAAERMLPADQLGRIHDAFEEHEERVIGAGRHEELHELLKKLKKKYAS